MEECLCWRANDWRKRLLINPFHLSQFPTQSKAFYLKGGCMAVIILSSDAAYSGQKEDARRGGRNRSFFLRARRPLALCGFFCLVRLAITLKSQTEEKRAALSLRLSQCIFVACRFPRRRVRAAYLTLHYVILSDRHAEHKEKLRKRFRIADTSKWAQTVCV